MRQVPANRIQHPLRQFLTAVHRYLPGAVLQRRVAIALDQQTGIACQIHTLHVQRRRLLLQHQRTRGATVVFVLHTVINMLVSRQIAQPGKKRVAAVQHAQLHLFKGQHVRHELSAGFFPLRTTGDKVVFNDPLTKRFAGDAGRVANAGKLFNFFQRFGSHRRYDAVNHGRRESDTARNPLG